MREPLISNVSDTARWMAAERAVESVRPDALFIDPFANRLAGDRGRAIAATAPRLTRNGWPSATARFGRSISTTSVAIELDQPLVAAIYTFGMTQIS